MATAPTSNVSEESPISTDSSLASRLASVRRDRELSLRGFAERLGEEASYDVSYSSVRDYEQEGSSPPARYVEAVSEAFGVDPVWLLRGEKAGGWRAGLGSLPHVQREIEELVSWLRDRMPAEEHAELVRRGWEQFTARSETDHPVRDVVIRSWRRSVAASVDPGKERPDGRLNESELARRRSESADLVTRTEQHLDWLELLLQDHEYTVGLTDSDGYMLLARATSDELLERSVVRPGQDWSEESMGTSGPGLALAEEKPVILIGAEHYARALHDVTCVGCPVLGADGQLRGVLSLAMPVRSTKPLALALACYTTWTITETMQR